jgi:hypothetical protein
MQIHLHIIISWRSAAFSLVLLLLIVGSHGHAGGSGDQIGCSFMAFSANVQLESNGLSFMELLSRVELEPIPEHEPISEHQE